MPHDAAASASLTLAQITSTAYGRVHAPRVIDAVELSGVRPDGTLDAALGLARFTVGADPLQRDAFFTDCPRYAWDARGERPIEPMGTCMATFQTRVPRCGATQLWQRALADGAPREGLARMYLLGSYRGDMQLWNVAIGSFARVYDDDCDPIVEAQ